VDVFKKCLVIDQRRVGATEFTVTGPGHVPAWAMQAISRWQVHVEHLNLAELTPLLSVAAPVAGKLSFE
jgi:hypothetical protein